MQEIEPWLGKIPWRRGWQSTPVFLPGKSHGPRNLVGYSPWGRKELDTTDHARTKYINISKSVAHLNMNVHINKNQLKLYKKLVSKLGFFASSVVKYLPANAGDSGLIPGLRRSPKGRHATHFSFLA